MSRLASTTEAVRDAPTVNAQGESLQLLPHGVSIHKVVTQVDNRGSVFELFDFRWGWNSEPLVYAYAFTVRPGIVKGWGIHEHHEDRYFLLFGEMEVVLHDARFDSPTRGIVSKVVMSEFNRFALNIPAGIWHADHNVGAKDAVVINFPTAPYEHDNPDKSRLPPNNDVIPYKFDNLRGG